MLLLQRAGCFLPQFIHRMLHLLKVLKSLDLKAYLKPESGFLLIVTCFHKIDLSCIHSSEHTMKWAHSLGGQFHTNQHSPHALSWCHFHWNSQQSVNLDFTLPSLLIGHDKKAEIMWHFQGRLCDKIGLLWDK